MRIIFVPQFPSNMRYQEWWYSEFPKQFRKRGFEVLVLGKDCIDAELGAPYDPANFSPINQAIYIESVQINEYMDLEIRDDDILFLTDLSFPGLFANVLYHKECPKMYAFCHATSINKLDYFQGVVYSKFPVESSHSFLFDAVFVGSKYHQRKLQAVDERYWRNTVVTYLPYQPYEGTLESFVPKEHLFMSASRPTPQKVDMELEEKIEDLFQTKIWRPTSNSWSEYFRNLRSSKFLLITAQEDTFGYQIVDAVTNDCIPLARNSLAYPELLPREYLYNDFDDFVLRYDCLVAGQPDIKPEIPRLLCDRQMKDFYNRICDEMLGKYDNIPF